MAIVVLSLVGVILGSVLFAVGLLTEVHWVTGVGLVLMPVALLWGLVARGAYGERARS
ncbi:MAG TPA: hypothetical protein VFB73_04995 [Chloroflexota bacterium]|nr:hypothetical protein [Chloroflexota bacterium]